LRKKHLNLSPNKSQPYIHKPVIFVASSNEGRKYVEAIENELASEHLDIKPWYRWFTDPMLSNIEQLESVQRVDFGVVVFTPDDITRSRSQKKYSPRDNLLFELGLLVGFLGKQRVFPLVPAQVPIKLPTDLLGTNPFQFMLCRSEDSILEYQAAVAKSCSYIKDRVSFIGQKPPLVGEPIRGYKSGIRFHNHVVFEPKTNDIVFKLAYNGSGTLIDAHFSAYFLQITKESTGNFYRRWLEMQLSKDQIPEVEVSWHLRHHIDQNSPISQFLDGMPSLDTIQAAVKKINLFVTGFDSVEGVRQFNKMTYLGTAITMRQFKPFYSVTEEGDVLLQTVNWEDFDNIV